MASHKAAMRIAVAQPPVVPYDLAANSRAHAAVVLECAARVVVFPELSLTGYHLDAPVVSPEDPRLEPLILACRQTDTLALAGAPVAGDHIAMLAVTGTGVTVAYRKRWLGEAEAERFIAGTEAVLLEVDGWRLGLAICRDTGQPQHTADTAALGVDVYVAGVLEQDRDAGVLIDRARRTAVDHGLWVAIASFAGSTGGGFDRPAGRSAIWASDGHVVSAAGTAVGEFAAATISAT